MLYSVLVEYTTREYKTRKRVRRTSIFQTIADSGEEAMNIIEARESGVVVSFYLA